MNRLPLILEQGMYIPSPSHFRSPPSTNDGPLPGSGIPRPYSLPSDQPLPSTMMVQPAFNIYGSMQPQMSYPEPDANVQYLGRREGFPTFFRPANRAGAGKADPSSGKPLGLRMLLLSPARYSVYHADQLTRKDVRLGIKQRKPTRQRVLGIPLGG